MTEAQDERFKEIIDAAINEAEAVECSIGVFYEGLRLMRKELETRIAISKEDGV